MMIATCYIEKWVSAWCIALSGPLSREKSGYPRFSASSSAASSPAILRETGANCGERTGARRAAHWLLIHWVCGSECRSHCQSGSSVAMGLRSTRTRAPTVLAHTRRYEKLANEVYQFAQRARCEISDAKFMHARYIHCVWQMHRTKSRNCKG